MTKPFVALAMRRSYLHDFHLAQSLAAAAVTVRSKSQQRGGSAEVGDQESLCNSSRSDPISV